MFISYYERLWTSSGGPAVILASQRASAVNPPVSLSVTTSNNAVITNKFLITPTWRALAASEGHRSGTEAVKQIYSNFQLTLTGLYELGHDLGYDLGVLDSYTSVPGSHIRVVFIARASHTLTNRRDLLPASQWFGKGLYKVVQDKAPLRVMSDFKRVYSIDINIPIPLCFFFWFTTANADDNDENDRNNTKNNNSQ